MKEGIDRTAERVEELRAVGRHIEAIAILQTGDPTEGCEGNYSNQLFTTELNTRDQIIVATDLQLYGLRTLSPLAPKIQYACALCNHGEMTRRGNKAVTDDADNAGALIAETMQRVLEGRHGFGHIEWSIPRDEMITMHDLSGVPVAMAHGHKIGGKEETWINAQAIRLLRTHGREPRIVVTGHRHHLSVTDFGAYTRIQCPSNDGGSKWFLDSSGKWSTAGTLTFLTGEHDERGFSDLQLL